MKIVINRCYGGFGLSNKAIKAYLNRKGKEAFFYKQSKYRFSDGEEEYTKINPNEIEGPFTYTFTEDLGEKINNVEKIDSWFYYRDIERTDPDLIEVVEQLEEEANGECSELEVVEIPDGIKYHISEYDGMERLEEEHRSWF